MTEDIYWKNFEGVAKASYAFNPADEAKQVLSHGIEIDEEDGIEIIDLDNLGR